MLVVFIYINFIMRIYIIYQSYSYVKLALMSSFAVRSTKFAFQIFFSWIT